MSMKEATIQINDLSIGYHSKSDTKLVASHITTTIYSGELTCLLGAKPVSESLLYYVHYPLSSLACRAK